MSENTVTNVLFAGIGGQGIIRASDMLTEIAYRMGNDVKKSELHGMSQRGGSVSSDVRFGAKVYSPMIPRGKADYLIAVSSDQVDVCAPFLNEKTVIIRETDVPEEYRGKPMMNVVMLGILNRYLGFPENVWIDLIRENFKGTVADDNVTAFLRGAGSAEQ